MTFKNDYATGLKSENEMMPILINYFNRDIKKTFNKYCKYDFEDNEYKYELKTRNNKYSTYPTTIVGCDKITNNKIIFLFKFIDGLYYIEYNEEQFKQFEKKPFVRNSRSDFIDIKKDYLFIPINFLNKII